MSNNNNNNNVPLTPEQYIQLIQQRESQLQQQQQQYNQQMLAFQQELQSLRTQMNNNNSSSSSSSSSSIKKKKSLYRPSQPPSFNGEHNNFIATQWIYKVEQFFIVAETEEEDKVNIAALSFEKNAMQWFVHLRDSLINKTLEEQRIIKEWLEFKKEFLKYFQPVEVSRLSRAKINDIKQTGTAAAYCNIFTQLLNNMGGSESMDLQNQLFLFRKGLYKSIRMYVDLKEPKSLDEAMRLAQRFEAEEYVSKSEERTYGNNNNNNNNKNKTFYNNNKINNNNSRYNNNHTNTTASSNHGAGPMDLNNIRRIDQNDPNNNNNNIENKQDEDNNYDEEERINYINNNNYNGIRSNNFSNNNNQKNYHNNNNNNQNSNRVVNLSKEEFKRCFKEGICFECKLKGHLARDCTNSKK